MKSRLILFIVIGILLGICGGVVTTVMSFQPLDIQVDEYDPAPSNSYFTLIAYGALIWGIFGLVNGILQFYFSIGKTPVLEDVRTGEFYPDAIILKNFDYRRVGSKLVYIFFIWGWVAVFLMETLLPFEGTIELSSDRIGYSLPKAF